MPTTTPGTTPDSDHNDHGEQSPHNTVRLPDPPRGTDPPGPRRRPGRRGLLIGAVIAVALLLAGTGAAIAFGVSRATALESRTITETFAGAREIVVDLDEGSVRLTAATGPDVQVRTIPAWTPGYEPAHSRALTDGVLTVRGDCPDFDLGCEVDQEIAVPAGVAVRISTVDGAVHAAGLDVPRFAATTVNGAVDAAFDRAPQRVEVGTVNGAATATVPPGPYRVSASAVVGAVTLGIPHDPTAAATIDAHTVNGAVTVRSS
ncbi:hypothetical protein GCM10009836_07320 [Pseudonocardia ailaonensis]|uniref:Adhesin domain-containing protein n=1 Tax=Pseudonocardia ailaonensis TaxID=367279 RepID=A0ABN2MML4_9PSEU